MSAPQRILRIRRDYNKWVANQTLEDYALRFTAKSARKWSAARVANTALGAVSFLALEAIGGTITVGFGFVNAVAAILSVGLLIFVSGLPISFYAARYGVDIDLLTRGAGFGYLGSTITSLIYASFTFIFFAIEAAILASVLEAGFGIPPSIGYLICAIAIIPLVTHGITFISRLQLWTQPIWLVLHVLPFAAIALAGDGSLGFWTSYGGVTGTHGFALLPFGAAASVVFSLIAQIGEQVDFLRFVPEPADGRRGLGWWSPMRPMPPTRPRRPARRSSRRRSPTSAASPRWATCAASAAGWTSSNARPRTRARPSVSCEAMSPSIGSTPCWRRWISPRRRTPQRRRSRSLASPWSGATSFSW